MHFPVLLNHFPLLKFAVSFFSAFLAVNAGFLAAPAAVSYSVAPAVSYSYGAPIAAQAPAITSQSSNIIRSFGNLGQISTYSKTIDTPFSSVRKADIRVSNPGLRIAAAPAVAYAAPAAGVAYSAAPAVAHVAYTNGYGISYGW